MFTVFASTSYGTDAAVIARQVLAHAAVAAGVAGALVHVNVAGAAPPLCRAHASELLEAIADALAPHAGVTEACCLS